MATNTSRLTLNEAILWMALEEPPGDILELEKRPTVELVAALWRLRPRSIAEKVFLMRSAPDWPAEEIRWTGPRRRAARNA